MNPKTRILITTAAALALAVAVLAVTLAQCGGPPAPATETPGATGILSPTASEERGTPTATPGPTPTPTEGEKAAEAVGREYIAYRPTQAECEQAVEREEVEACVWPHSTDLITQPEWEQLFPSTRFYLLDLAGYDEVYGYDHRLRLAAAHDGRYYTAETFDRLLAANGITEITDENRELVAQAFALMTIYDYLEEQVIFTDWEVVDMQPALHNYNYCLTAWTRLGGLELQWCFVFDERLRIATGPAVLKYETGDYILVSPDELGHPIPKDYVFAGG